MNKLFILLFANLFAISVAFSQGAAINTTGASADPSAMLDVSSSTQGMLVPRMTEAQKIAIVSPANGLLIYQTNNTSGFWYFNGTIWLQAIGPAGANGAPGATGPAGANGTQGATGTTGANGTPGATGPIGQTGTNGSTGPSGPASGSNPITHVSAVSGSRISWLQCYNNCYNMSATPASPADGITYTDWRMPNAAEAVYYRNTFTPPTGGWLNASYPNYIWTTDMHQSQEDSWVTVSESGSWNGNNTNTSMYCRCVK